MHCSDIRDAVSPIGCAPDNEAITPSCSLLDRIHRIRTLKCGRGTETISVPLLDLPGKFPGWEQAGPLCAADIKSHINWEAVDSTPTAILSGTHRAVLILRRIPEVPAKNISTFETCRRLF